MKIAGRTVAANGNTHATKAAPEAHNRAPGHAAALRAIWRRKRRREGARMRRTWAREWGR